MAVSLRPGVLYGTVILIGLCTIGFAKWKTENLKGDTRNFAVTVHHPKGWQREPQGLQTLFLYRDKKSNLLIRGAQNQVVSDINPTPELHTKGIAQYYIDVTHENLKGWTAEMLETVPGNGIDFQLIRRTREGKEVVSAFAVKGNTTLVVSLSGNDNEVKSIPATLPAFREFLTGIEFREVAEDRLAARIVP